MKIGMICFKRVWNWNKNGTGGMNTAKNDVFIFLLGWIDFWWEGIEIWLRGGEWANFWLVRGLQQLFIWNEEAPRTSHTSCPKVAILILQDLSTLCVTDIYGIYFRSSVQCPWYNKFIMSINIMNMFNQVQWWEKYLCIFGNSLIKHTCSWRDIKHKVKWMVNLWKAVWQELNGRVEKNSHKNRRLGYKCFLHFLLLCL